jgi:SAM-dependent methyltransferase
VGNGADPIVISHACHRTFRSLVFDPIEAATEHQPWTARPFDVDPDVAKRALGSGRRRFDTPDAASGLSPGQLALIYAYSSMRMHYCEVRHALRAFWDELAIDGTSVQLYDFGCGPATAGLAFACHAAEEGVNLRGRRYWGVDESHAMLTLAERFGERVLEPAGYVVEYEDRLPVDGYGSAMQTGVFLASYLFASDSLDPDRLARDVHRLRREHERFVVLTVNSDLAIANTKGSAFAKELRRIGGFRKLRETAERAYFPYALRPGDPVIHPSRQHRRQAWVSW